MIKAGIVGCGGAAWIGHLPWLWENPHIELVATCALDETDARQAAERWGADRFYTDYDEMLAADSLDAVIIATPPQTHAAFSVAAAERGIHVLVEKPMARSVKECDSIIRAVEKSGTVFSISHEKHFNPGFEKIKEIIESGLLGDVFYLVVHWSAAVRLDPDLLCPPDYRESYHWRWTDKEADQIPRTNF